MSSLAVFLSYETHSSPKCASSLVTQGTLYGCSGGVRCCCAGVALLLNRTCVMVPHADGIPWRVRRQDLCAKPPDRGLGLARSPGMPRQPTHHLPDQAQGGLRPPPAPAHRQKCSGWTTTRALVCHMGLSPRAALGSRARRARACEYVKDCL